MPNNEETKDVVEDEVPFVLSAWNMNFGGVPINQSSPVVVSTSTRMTHMKPGCIVSKGRRERSANISTLAVVFEKCIYLCSTSNKVPSLASALGSVSVTDTFASKNADDGKEGGNPALSVVVNLGGSVLDARQHSFVDGVQGQQGTDPRSWWPTVETANKSERSLIAALQTTKDGESNHKQTHDGLGVKKLFDDYMAQRTQNQQSNGSGVQNTAVNNTVSEQKLLVSPHFARTAASTFLLNLKGDELDTVGEYESSNSKNGRTMYKTVVLFFPASF